MLRNFNVILILSLSWSYLPSHAKEISSNQKYLSSNVEEVVEEMNHLNLSLDILSNTISNLLPRNRI